MSRTLKKVLIANRGEIAVRIARGCRELGIPTVAVYSEADRDAPHTHFADEAVEIGPAPPDQSYLSIERLLGVARKHGVDAVHPGYGFLSENADFAAAVADAGLTFIGPTAATMRKLGDKAAARELALSAGVPVIPGAPIDDGSLEQTAGQIGYPLLLKAAAGGGGKGMRAVHAPGELRDAFGSARREAKSAFGDDTIIVEKLIERPRHIEVQILADAHGNRIHLGERECSIQRRHQKIVEEAPSPVVDEALRARLGAAALSVIEAADYVNAGTVEFLLAPDGSFYFLEVNARLQVEHPVTEAVTDVDLVHQQLRIAAGEPLALRQEDVGPRGHAIECRVYAEDPARDFAPSPGEVLVLAEPTHPGVRIDSGIRQGQRISVHYDPILAKIIAFAPSRPGAIAKMSEALREYAILGCQTNVPFLYQLFQHPALHAGDLSTGFLAQHFPDWKPPSSDATINALAAVLASAAPARDRGAGAGPAAIPSPWARLAGWRQR